MFAAAACVRDCLPARTESLLCTPLPRESRAAPPVAAAAQHPQKAGRHRTAQLTLALNNLL